MKFQILLAMLLSLSWSVYAQQTVFSQDFELNHSGIALWVKTDEGATGAATADFTSTEAAHTGSQGARITVTSGSSENWHVQLQISRTSWTPVEGNLYRISFKGRGPASAHMGISDGAYTYLTGENIAFSSSWQSFATTILASTSPILVNLYLADATGNYDIDDLLIEDLGAPDTEWYETAQNRIDTLRRGTIRVQVTDSEGVSRSNIGVQVKLKQHDFPFGTALNFKAVKPKGTETFNTYKEKVAEMFWAGVTENAFKWPDYEPTQGNYDQEGIEEYLDWTEAQGWKLMRGHAFVWGIEKYNFDQHWPRQGTCEELSGYIKERINRDAALYAGRFHQYDVWNEIFHETAIFDRCSWDLLDSAFVWAHAADPDALLFLNEYSVISGGSTEQYYGHIERMINAGLPIHGIGVQGHFGAQDVEPGLVKSRLDRLAEFGLPIVITEYDVGSMTEGVGTTAADELRQAENHGKLIRTAFSHPAVEGIILWGFWDDQHWIENGGVYRSDWSAKPAADTLLKLWNEVWTTDELFTTNSSGEVVIPAYYGSYEIQIGEGEEAVIHNMELTKEQGELLIQQSYEGPVSGLEPARSSLLEAFGEFQVFAQQGNLKILCYSCSMGEEFRVYQANGTLASKATSNSKGTAVVEDLTPGYYSVIHGSGTRQVLIP